MQWLLRSCNRPRPYCSKSFSIALVTVAFLAVTVDTGRAQTTTWVGGGATNNWSDVGNWDNGIPQDGYNVEFATVGTPSNMDIVGLTLNHLDMISYQGTLTLHQDLTTTGYVRVGGVFSLNGRSLNVGTDAWVYSSGFLDVNSSTLDVDGLLAIEGGDVIGSNATIIIADDFIGISGSVAVGGLIRVTGDVVLPGLSMLDLSGCELQLWTHCGSLQLYLGHVLGDVTIVRGSATDVVNFYTSGASVAVYGDITVTTGILDLANADVAVNGLTTVSASGTVRNLTGTGQPHRFLGGVTIDGGTFTMTAPSVTLTFGDGSTVDVNGTGVFSIHGGGGGGRISLENASSTSQWHLDYEPTATAYIRNANIEWGIASPPLIVYGCVDMGNNTDFIFAEPEIDVSHITMDFDTVRVGTTAYRNLTVYNIGADTLDVSLVETTLPEFVPSPTAFFIPPADSQIVAVSFTPSAVADYADTLSVHSNDSDEPVVPVSLYGRGDMPNLVASTFNLNTWDLTNAGDTLVATYTVDNGGPFASGPFRVSFMLSLDAVYDTNDFTLNTVIVSNILPHADTSGTWSLVMPKTAPRGSLNIGMVVDDLEQVEESNESDNVSSHPFDYQVPLIHSIIDVPLDQGGQVFLSWYASPLDTSGGITEYTLWRTIDIPLVPSTVEGAALIESAREWSFKLSGRVVQVETTPQGPVFWENIATHGAFQFESYGMALPTLFDSTTAGFQYHYFKVIAHTSNPATYYQTAVDSGYSVDNLAPAAPLNLAAEQTEPEALRLTWDQGSEADLSHYAVYRGTDPGFTPGPSNLIGEPTEHAFLDPEWRWDGGYYYKVSAIDINGNESPYASTGPDEITGAEETEPPKIHYLAQNKPNPFGAETRIEFGMARDAHVTVRIYDVAGRLVRTLVDGRRAGDHYSVHWDGRDDSGSLVAGGIYFYRMTVGTFVQTKKLALLR